MENVTLVGAAQVIVVFGAAVGVLWRGYRMLLKAFDERVRATNAVHDAALEKKLDEKLGSIKAELSPNSGSSLRDKVNEIATGFETLRDVDNRRHKENSDRLASQQRQIDAIRRAFMAVLKAAKSGNTEAPIPGLTDELITDLDDADERKGRYRRERWPREEDA